MPKTKKLIGDQGIIFDNAVSKTRERTYVMITYVSKENNLGPDDKIRCISGVLKVRVLFC